MQEPAGAWNRILQDVGKAFFELQDQLKGMENAMRNALKKVEKSGSQAYNDVTKAKNMLKRGDAYADRRSDQTAARSGNQGRLAQNARGNRTAQGTDVGSSNTLNDTQRRKIREVITLAMDKTEEGRACLKQDSIDDTMDRLLSVIMLTNEHDALLTELYKA